MDPPVNEKLVSCFFVLFDCIRSDVGTNDGVSLMREM